MSEPTRRARPNLQNEIYLDLRTGGCVIQLLPELAPKHVERVNALAARGFKDGHAVPSGYRGFHGAGR